MEKILFFISCVILFVVYFTIVEPALKARRIAKARARLAEFGLTPEEYLAVTKCPIRHAEAMIKFGIED